MPKKEKQILEDESGGGATIIETVEMWGVFKNFRPRFQVNADKLELTFEVDWNRVTPATLGKLKSAAQGFGKLIFHKTMEPKGSQDPVDPTEPGLDFTGKSKE